MSSGGSNFYKDDNTHPKTERHMDFQCDRERPLREIGGAIREAGEKDARILSKIEACEANTPKFVTKDSGKRHEEITGAIRDTNEGKGRFDLISPIALKRLAQLYERGAVKYGDRNWEKGINLARYLDSAQRHINDFLNGDRSEDHITAAAWNCFGFVHTEQKIREGVLPTELDNIPSPRPHK